MEISLATARKLALYAQGLDGHWTLSPGTEGAAQVIEHLGYVQIDTIAVIQRAHHHTVWSRYPDYHPQMLHTLLAKERRVFEGWTHAMSYIPMRDYGYYVHRIGPHAVRGRRREWLDENQDVVARVRARIQEEGPLGSADFKKPKNFKGSWWNWKPAKYALEVLFDMGELMVTHRHNFQRIFDLKERVLPPEIETTPPDDETLQRFIIQRTLGGRGILRENEIMWARQRADLKLLQALVEAGEVTALQVEGIPDKTCYAMTNILNAVAQSPTTPQALHILSPFDNLTIRRRWLQTFFDGFKYRLECYLPAAKRQYGYFVLPILWGDHFIARIDTKADRKPKTFIVRRLIFEPDFADYEVVLPALAHKLRAFATFNNCETFAVEDVTPKKVKAPLVSALTNLTTA